MKNKPFINKDAINKINPKIYKTLITMMNTPLLSLYEEEKTFAPPTNRIPITTDIVPIIYCFLIFLFTRIRVKIKVEIMLPPLNI